MFDPPQPPTIKGTMHPRFDEILTPEALAFIAKLDGALAGRRAELLAARRERARADLRRRDSRLPARHQTRSAATPRGGSPRRRRG